jgi:hypothetical protein
MTLDERSSLKKFGNGVESTYKCVICGLIDKSKVYFSTVTYLL